MRLRRGRHPRRRRQCHRRRQWSTHELRLLLDPIAAAVSCAMCPWGCLQPPRCKWHNHLLILHIMTCSIDGVGRIRIESRGIMLYAMCCRHSLLCAAASCTLLQTVACTQTGWTAPDAPTHAVFRCQRLV